jgi:hypothetical protein
VRYYPNLSLEELRITTKKVRIVIVTAKIRTELVSNGCHKEFRFTSLTLFV